MTINISNLSSLYIDILKESGNIGAGNAATSLAKMIEKRIDMNVPVVRILEISEVTDILGGAEIPVIGILIGVSGEIKGTMMFILELEAAYALVNILMGKPLESRDEFSEIEYSALREVGNILSSSYLSALSTLTNLKVVPTVPDLAVDMAGAILSVPAIEFGKVGDTVLYIETEFYQGTEKVVGDFFLILEVDSYEILLKALGVI